MRVSSRASTTSLWTLNTSALQQRQRGERGDQHARAQRAASATIAVRRRAGTGSGTPAASSARRSATGCRGRGTAGSAPGASMSASRRWRTISPPSPPSGEQRRQPAEAPGEGVQVVPPAAGVSARPSLPPSSPAASVCLRSRRREPWRSSSAYGLATRNASSDGANANARPRSRRGRPATRTPPRRPSRRTIPAVVLGRDREPRPTPASTYSRMPAGAVDPRHADQDSASGASVGASLSAKWSSARAGTRPRAARPR